MEFISTLKATLFAVYMFCLVSNNFGQTKNDSISQILLGNDDLVKYSKLIRISGETLMTDPEISYRAADEALIIATRLNDNTKIARAHHSIGGSKGRLGDYPVALKHLNLALEYFTKVNDENMVVYTQNDIAGLYVNIKRYETALDIYNQLLTYYFKNNLMEKYCSILNNVGIILTNKGDLDKALLNYSKAWEIKKKIKPNDTGFFAVLYGNIGETYFAKKDYGSSLKYRKLALELYEKLNIVDGIANLQMDTGESLIKLKDLKSARLYLDSALANYTSIKYSDGIRQVKKLFVELYRETNQLDDALFLCAELDKLSAAQEDTLMLTECYKYYSEIYKSKGNYELSSGYYIKYINLREKMDEMNNKQRILELQNVFETEVREYENKTLRRENELQKEKLNSSENMIMAVSIGVIATIILLLIVNIKEKKIRKINRILQEQNKRLEEHIVSKDKFFSILAHNLKNPFWAVLGQNKMLETEYAELTENERKDLIKGIGASASNVYKLFEDLLKWAKSQQNAIEVEKERVNLRDLIQSSVRPYLLIAANKKIRIEINVRNEIEIEADRFMMETVIGNLVDNAIKFSVQDESVIVSAYRTGDEIEIHVQDFGLGINQEKLDKLFKIDEDVSSVGTANERGTGLGLIICKEFVEKQKGKIKVDSRYGNGTTFSVILPVS